MNDQLVLVLSSDPMIAGLLGALLEVHAYRACFADPDEHPRDAARRHRPGMVLIDCDAGLACSDEVLGPVRMMGSRVILFSHNRSRDETAPLVDRHQAEFFELPVHLGDFGNLLKGAGR